MKKLLLLATLSLSIASFANSYEPVESKEEADLIRESILVEMNNLDLDCINTTGDWDLDTIKRMFEFPVTDPESASKIEVSVDESTDESIKFYYEWGGSGFHYTYEFIATTEDNFHVLTGLKINIHKVSGEKKVNIGSLLEPIFNMERNQGLRQDIACTVKEL